MFVVKYRKDLSGIVPNHKEVEHVRLMSNSSYEDVLKYVEWLKTVRCSNISVEEYQLVRRVL